MENEKKKNKKECLAVRGERGKGMNETRRYIEIEGGQTTKTEG